MNKRNLALLALIVVCAVVIGLLVYYLIFFKGHKTDQQQTPEATVKTPAATLITNASQTATKATATAAQIQPTSAEEIVQQDAGQVAKIFVERFGTYSNQVGAEQFSDLQLFVTAKMQTWVNGQIAKIIGTQADYQTARLVVTKAVAAEVTSLDQKAGTATVMVGARRSNQTGDAAPQISNPEIKVEMVKAGKRWKVDGVVWQ